MNQVPVQSNHVLQYKIPLDCDNAGQFRRKLISLMKVVMKRSRGQHWTEELRAFYESIEKDEGEKNG